jgi:hypothetical protein
MATFGCQLQRSPPIFALGCRVRALLYEEPCRYLHGRLRNAQCSGVRTVFTLCLRQGPRRALLDKEPCHVQMAPFRHAQLQESPPVFALGSHAGVVLDDVGTVSRPEGARQSQSNAQKCSGVSPSFFSLGCRVPHRARRGTVPCQSPKKGPLSERPNASGVFPTVPCPRTTVVPFRCQMQAESARLSSGLPRPRRAQKQSNPARSR